MLSIPKINSIPPIAKLSAPAKYLWIMLAGEADSNGVTLFDPHRWRRLYFPNDKVRCRTAFEELVSSTIVKHNDTYVMLGFYQDVWKTLQNRRQPQFKHPQQLDLINEKSGRALSSFVRKKPTPNAKIPREKIIEAWNQHLVPVGCPAIHIMSDALKAKISTRWREDPLRQNISWWEALFAHIAGFCPFLIGKNNGDWIITIDWLMRPDNLAKVLNGNYDNRVPSFQPKGRTYAGK